MWWWWPLGPVWCCSRSGAGLVPRPSRRQCAVRSRTSGGPRAKSVTRRSAPRSTTCSCRTGSSWARSARVGQELDGKKSLIDQQLGSMNAKLDEVVDAHADARGRPRAQVRRALRAAHDEPRGRHVADADDAEPPRSAVEHQGARSVGRAHGRRRAPARRLRRERQLPQAEGARERAACPTSRSCSPTSCCCTWT